MRNINIYTISSSVCRYGPTEITVGILAKKNVTKATEVLNIGHRLRHNVLYVLDERLRPVPMGCVGELFIGGPQLTGGYLNNPEQTAKVFIGDPFRPGYQMYATGDLIRMNPNDESFTFIGRRDTQIKIRGLRVEIGEIEAVINSTSNAIAKRTIGGVSDCFRTIKDAGQRIMRVS